MKTLEIKLPNKIFSNLKVLSENKNKFIIEAIKEKIARENKRLLLVEGYQTVAKEELSLSNEQKICHSKKLRPFGLSKNDFVVPDNFDTALSKEFTADFEN